MAPNHETLSPGSTTRLQQLFVVYLDPSLADVNPLELYFANANALKEVVPSDFEAVAVMMKS